MFLTCPVCDVRHRRCDSWRYGDFCSRECYEAVPFPRVNPRLTHNDLYRVCRMNKTQKQAAAAIGVSYVRFRRVISSLGLRDYFPDRGGAATWA